MNRIISSSLTVLLIAASGAALIGCDIARGDDTGTRSASRGHSSSIGSTEAHALVAEGATLLDVRTPQEWERGHVEGAILIPIGDLEARIAEVPRNHPVVVYCASGARSARAASTLAAAGYDMHDLGAMSRWRQ